MYLVLDVTATKMSKNFATIELSLRNMLITVTTGHLCSQ